MQPVLATLTTNLSELKKSPSKVLATATEAPIAIIDNDRVIAYLISAELYESMQQHLDKIAS